MNAIQVVGWEKGKPQEITIFQVASGKHLREDAARSFLKMAEKARQDGLPLRVNSAWRSYDHQKRLYDRWKKTGQGPRPAKPGWSNHHNGIAVDINRAHDDPDGSGPLIGKTDGWLAENAKYYGYIKPYSWEPWHWEYRPERCQIEDLLVG